MTTHGGKRRGAGRKPLYPYGPRVSVSLFLPTSFLKTMDRLRREKSRSAWLTELLAKKLR